MPAKKYFIKHQVTNTYSMRTKILSFIYYPKYMQILFFFWSYVLYKCHSAKNNRKLFLNYHCEQS